MYFSERTVDGRYMRAGGAGQVRTRGNHPGLKASDGLKQALVTSRKSGRALPPSLVQKKDDKDRPGLSG
jgi:hypothetical protein